MQEVKEVAKVRAGVYRVSGNFLRHMLNKCSSDSRGNQQAMCITCYTATCVQRLFSDTAFHGCFSVYLFGNFSLQFMENHARLGDNHMFCDFKGTYINMFFSIPC